MIVALTPPGSRDRPPQRVGTTTEWVPGEQIGVVRIPTLVIPKFELIVHGYLGNNMNTTKKCYIFVIN